MDIEALIEIATKWSQTDPDPHTRNETKSLIEQRDEHGLREQFGARLEFGTAGIRGALGAGPNRMNRALVQRVCAGLGQYLSEEFTGPISVVIGYDGRRGSREFALDTACVLGEIGITSYLADEVIPTPRLAHATTYLGAQAGVMVTASHNPPSDNGYKVYWDNGAQIIPPHDAGISRAIDAVDPLEITVGDEARLRLRGLIKPHPPEVERDYIQRVLALRIHTGATLPAVYTAMHGVGYASLARVLAAAGHEQVTAVPEQRDPDGTFPTVSFPNPEEPGALDLAYRTADEIGANLIIANDPDADRLAVALREADGSWRQLTGNQIGALLANDLLANGPQEPKRVVATTIVSSTLLAQLAAHYGVEYAETLTGFKWIANKALELEATGHRFVMGYEEALGYSIGPVVRDKDGISAALLLLDLAAHCAQKGRTLVDELVRIYRTHGYYGSLQHGIKMEGTEGKVQIAAIMSQLRSNPPREIGNRPITAITDVGTGVRLDLETGESRAVALPPSNVLCFDLADGSRVLARPSGTEPKIKFYFEVRIPMGEREALTSAEARADAQLQVLKSSLLEHIGLSEAIR
jgi:phosphomannomutase